MGTVSRSPSRRRAHRSSASKRRASEYSAVGSAIDGCMSVCGGALLDEFKQFADGRRLLHVDVFQHNVEAVLEFEDDVDHARRVDAEVFDEARLARDYGFGCALGCEA